MEKDRRYFYAKDDFNNGRVKKFADLFRVLRKSTLATDLKYHNDKITRMISNPEEFPLAELFDVCERLEIDPKEFILMVLDNYLPERNRQE